ncbi:MAG: GHKL domain-containing protein [Candidatus Heimdallarchaeota archaeon]|nr:GHKL domain-containing protein [Candidatus Heimdallarchaeota archaeon]
MNIPVLIIESIALFATLLAIVVLSIGWKKRFDTKTKIIILFLLVLFIFHSLSNVLEWSDLFQFLDEYEDFIQILEPLVFGFVLYSFIQNNELEIIKRQNELINEKKLMNELLLDVISHDLVNYNQIVSGNIEILETVNKNAESVEEKLEKMKQAITNSNMLISNVKVLSRLEEKGIGKDLFQLIPMIKSAIIKVREVRTDIPLVVDIKTEFPEVSVKGNHILEAVFINLIDNAVKYKKQNQKEVKIEIEVEQEKDTVIISIKDQGLGIVDNLKEEVFNRFSIENQDKRSSGLGLSISKRIIKALGGRIWIENRTEFPDDYSAGSVFKISLKDN